MRSRLFTLAPAVSLLLCLAMAVLWVRSMWIHDEISRVVPRSAVSIISLHGRIQVEIVSVDHPVYVKRSKWTRRRIGGAINEIEDRFSWKLGGFWFSQFDGFSVSGLGPSSFTASGRTFVVPDWFLIGLFAHATPGNPFNKTTRPQESLPLVPLRPHRQHQRRLS